MDDPSSPWWLQRPRPSRLKVRPESQLPGAPEHDRRKQRQGHSPRDPVRVYDRSPAIIHTSPSEFRALVQRLTGQRSGSLPSEAPTQEDHHEDEVVQVAPEMLLLPPVAPTSPQTTTADDRFDDGSKRRRLQKFRSQIEQARQAKKSPQKLHHTQASVCALVDAMFRLPAKLDGLLATHGHTLPRGAEDEIPLIKQDLEKMVSFLQEHADSGAEDPSMMAKCLTKEVRELSYDMEDTVDQYVHAADSRRGILSPRPNKYKITRRRSKATSGLREKLKWRLWMANKIREFSVRSQEAIQRYSLFNNLGDIGGRSAGAAFTRSESDASFGESTSYGELVGIDGHANKLQEWLGKDGEQKLKVVSIVGSGGIGKTTLAKELYRRIGGLFECRAFVRTSRKPDVRRLLISMLSQIRPHQPTHNWKLHSLIADIRTHLQDKRYLIVIDDVWATQTWDIINRALPASSLCSGILITTEFDDVALKCCDYDPKYVLTVKPLGQDDSSKLFFSTVFGPQYDCPPELSEVANNIIRKCAGLPLAMVTVASVLANQIGKPEKWDYVNNFLGYGVDTNPRSEGMKQVLNLSYNNLPQHLKACVMYLSIYEEDCIIQKDDLVKQWIAEGLIHAIEEKDKEEIYMICFDELISSRMVQPVHVNDNDDVLSCTMHHMVLDFIKHKSLEENFVTALDHCQITARFADKVRRLSLHFGNAEAMLPTNMRMSQIRTLAFFGVIKCLPSIVEFGLLQVLILHLWGDDESISFDITGISGLFRLKYLHVTCNAILEVSQTQIRGLQYLETLKIEARISAVPSDIVRLPGLVHLSLPVETTLPNGIGCMTSLCTLGYFDLSVNSIDNVHGLGELKNLWDLRLTCSTVHSCHLKSKMDSVSSILTKLSNLRSLTLEPTSILDSGPSSISISCDGLSSVSSPPALLQRFEWLPRICTFSNLPKWIGHLDKLCILKIGITKLAWKDVDVLRGLPALTVLSLYVRANPVEGIVFNKTGFSVLKYFKFWCSVPWLEFEVGAMPNLCKLKLGFDAHGGDQHVPVGIEHLAGLKEISVKIGGVSPDDPDRIAAESAVSHAINMHPTCPTFNIQCVDVMFASKDNKNSGVELQKQYKSIEENSVEQSVLLQEGLGEDAESRCLDWENTSDKQVRRTDISKQVQDNMKKGEEAYTGQQKQQTWGFGQQQQGMDASANNPASFSELTVQATSSEMAPDGVYRQTHLQRRSSADGYNWRKYGQKQVKGSENPRSYYKCTYPNCPTKKKVETSIEGQITEIVYEGTHNHAKPLSTRRGSIRSSAAGSQVLQSGGGAAAENSLGGMSGAMVTTSFVDDENGSSPRPDNDDDEADSKRWKKEGDGEGVNIAGNRTAREPRVVVHTTMSDIDILDDGYRWRKYGQKVVKGNPNLRSYYKCTTVGCPGRKHVERASHDLRTMITTYEGKHNHDVPAARGSAASTSHYLNWRPAPPAVSAVEHGGKDEQMPPYPRLLVPDSTGGQG